LIDPEFKLGGTVGRGADVVEGLVGVEADAAVAAAAGVDATTTNIGEAVTRGARGRDKITYSHKEMQLTAKKAAIKPNDHSGTAHSRRRVDSVISPGN
jgi:hypothetical protein